MEYKINGFGHREEYYFNDEGQVYYYMPQSVNKVYLKFNKQVREVHSAQPGRSTHYLVVPLYSAGVMADWVDVADTMARTAFKISTSTRGYVRHKNHDYTDLSLKNLEFIVQHPKHSRPCAIHDYNGSIPYNMYKEEEEDTSKEKVQWTDLPGADSILAHRDKVLEGRKEMDLGERDRSVVAETLYILIEDRGYAVSNAVAVLMLEDTADVLRLYLEGRDSVYKTSDETIAKVNQERDSELYGVVAQINATCNRKIVDTSNKPAINQTGKHYRI